MLMVIGVILLLGMGFAVFYNQLTGLHNEVVIAAQRELSLRNALREQLEARVESEPGAADVLASLQAGGESNPALPPSLSFLRPGWEQWVASRQYLKEAQNRYTLGRTSFPGVWIARMGRFPAQVLPGGL
jgi:hypothetical protein